MCKKTPLYAIHQQLGGKLVPFAGYWLPIQYETGIVKEHLAVRNACGVFDVSHMGEVEIVGPDALANLQHLLVNDMDGMTIGRCRYSPMCNHQGGVVDDLLVCRLGDTRYWLIVNAANKEKDVQWIRDHLFGDVVMRDLSDHYAQLALQGPKAEAVLQTLMRAEDIPQKNYTFCNHVKVGGISCLVSFTGYTGEKGYELYCANADAEELLQMLLEKGADFGLIPCGLGARDTLRLEASMPLYGHEMNDEITPLEAGLGMFVKMDKPDFIGRDALVQKGEPTRIRVGLKVVDRGIVREQTPLFMGETQVGVVTSGTMLPYVGASMAMALVDKSVSGLGTQMDAEVRGRKIRVEVVALPFYKRT